jgi:hypothetical protein
MTKSAQRFPIVRPLPKALVEKWRLPARLHCVQPVGQAEWLDSVAGCDSGRGHAAWAPGERDACANNPGEPEQLRELPGVVD